MAVMAPADPTYTPFLALDVDGGNGPTQTTYPAGWSWESIPYGCYGAKWGTVTKTVGDVTVTLTSVNYGGGANGDGRDRGKPDGGNDQYLSNVYRDFVYIPRNGPLLGVDWIEVKLEGLAEQTAYEVTLFNFDKNHDWEGPQPDVCTYKFMAWGVDNPGDYTTIGYHPGPDPCAPYEVMVPCAGSLPGPGPNEISDPWAYSGSFFVTTDDWGEATLYGWFHAEQWSSLDHALINGLALGVPEPATVALLGLGGLALVCRRKR